jgi:hypothetical protein
MDCCRHGAYPVRAQPLKTNVDADQSEVGKFVHSSSKNSARLLLFCDENGLAEKTQRGIENTDLN